MNMRWFIGLLFLGQMIFCVDWGENAENSMYAYLVGTVEYDGMVQELMLKQTDKNTTELYRLDLRTNMMFKELSSQYTPAGISVLSSKKAYSFIDNGRVRIKDLVKRSPAVLDFSRPIYNVSRIHWLNDELAYCHAQEGHRFGVYFFDRDGAVQCILHDQGYDYLFPSIVDDKLFYIYRCAEYDTESYAICAVSLDKNRMLVNKDDQEHIVEFHDKALAFLHMVNQDCGFVLAYSRSIDLAQKCIPLQYYMLEKKENTWSVRQLFVFEVPTFLINDNDERRLYESVVPLLPLHQKNTIYYVSCSDFEPPNLHAYSFDLMSGTIKECSLV